jgi:hypothetical protein
MAQPEHPGMVGIFTSTVSPSRRRLGNQNGKLVTSVTSSLSLWGFSGKASEGLSVPVGAVQWVCATNNDDGLSFAFTAALTSILINSGG